MRRTRGVDLARLVRLTVVSPMNPKRFRRTATLLPSRSVLLLVARGATLWKRWSQSNNK